MGTLDAGDVVQDTDFLWQAWTPTLANLTLGAGGTVVAKYAQVGKIVHFSFVFTFGTGSAVGTNPTFTLPVATANVPWKPMGGLSLVDNGGSTYGGAVLVSSATTASPQVYTASGTYAAYTTPISATVPFTWAAGDQLIATGTYEAA